ncbi:MAG: family 43 glycosylhydrolase [Lachnospiraceae bacterium]|nr:family 43 glycosylhydrolase [Lachnospiraceae bacterium]
MEVLDQITNPYLPTWEFIPDGEPYIFNGRLYVYGSHDIFGGDVYCMGDYVCWSADPSDLGSWRFEGVIYTKEDDPENADLQGNLYAPDVTVGPDGRYYLYYVLSNRDFVSVAVCDEPAGKYEFYGYVHYEDGVRLGEREGDEPQFDPGVLTEGGDTYLYTGFCPLDDTSRHGAMCTVLGPDMLTVRRPPVFVVPAKHNSKCSGYEGHAYFEAASIRKKDGKYYFIYSSEVSRELCYATSDRPDGDFTYRGVLIDNGDIGIGSYKRADMPGYYCANNHGSMIDIGGQWYIFYHRHTNGTNYSRQGCFEKLTPNGPETFAQAALTSCAGTPFEEKGFYPADLACNLFTAAEQLYVPWCGWMDDRFPKITRAVWNPDEQEGYIANMRDTAVAGFKYFVCRDTKVISVRIKGYATGLLEVRTKWDGKCLGSFPVEYSNVWRNVEGSVNIPDGVNSIFFTFSGTGYMQFGGFEIR